MTSYHRLSHFTSNIRLSDLEHYVDPNAFNTTAPTFAQSTTDNSYMINTNLGAQLAATQADNNAAMLASEQIAADAAANRQAANTAQATSADAARTASAQIAADSTARYMNTADATTNAVKDMSIATTNSTTTQFNKLQDTIQNKDNLRAQVEIAAIAGDTARTQAMYDSQQKIAGAYAAAGKSGSGKASGSGGTTPQIGSASSDFDKTMNTILTGIIIMIIIGSIGIGAFYWHQSGANVSIPKRIPKSSGPRSSLTPVQNTVIAPKTRTIQNRKR